MSAMEQVKSDGPSVHISTEMRALWRALHRPSLTSPAPVASSAGSQDLGREKPRYAEPWSRMVLRRDGFRPLVVFAALICTSEKTTHSGIFRCSMFLEESGKLIFHSQWRAVKESCQRPIYRAAFIKDFEDFFNHLAGLGLSDVKLTPAKNIQSPPAEDLHLSPAL